MGNDSSLVRHIDHAKKTGVCVLKEQKLSEVSSRAINSPVSIRDHLVTSMISVSDVRDY